MSSRFYLLLSLLIVPVHMLLWQLMSLIDLPAAAFPLMAFPALVCCVLQWWVRRARIMSWGSLWVCLLLPAISGIATPALYVANLPGRISMEGLVIVFSLAANVLCSILLLLLRGITCTSSQK